MVNASILWLLLNHGFPVKFDLWVTRILKKIFANKYWISLDLVNSVFVINPNVSHVFLAVELI